MNAVNENQHWVSRILLKRFRIDGLPLQCYQVGTGTWVEKSIERVCSSPGYNQLLSSGDADNSLESAFSKVESRLQRSLRVLECAATNERTILPQAIHENICWYFSFLKGVAPYSKPGAVVSFLYQLNMELEIGQTSLLRELGLDESTIRELRRHHSNGNRIVVDAPNLLQLLYRFQFARNYQLNFGVFRNAKWTVSKSPIEFPISDVGLVPIFLQDCKANHYILPIGPEILLHAISFHDVSKNSSDPVVRGISLSAEEALYYLECVSASAISELICARKLPNVAKARTQAKENGIRFCKIVDPGAIKDSGLLDAGTGEFVFKIVSVEEYVRVVHSYLRPWE